MNPYLALQLAEQHQAQLRRDSARRPLADGSGRRLMSGCGATMASLRRSLGWHMVEAGLSLALSGDETRQGGPIDADPARLAVSGSER
ncbi:MAG: hypothetical protein ACRDZ5_00305 [Acidimicrobiales bacterium]